MTATVPWTNLPTGSTTVTVTAYSGFAATGSPLVSLTITRPATESTISASFPLGWLYVLASASSGSTPMATGSWETMMGPLVPSTGTISVEL